MIKSQLPHWLTSDCARAKPIALCPPGKSLLQLDSKAAKDFSFLAAPAYSARAPESVLTRVANTGSARKSGFPLSKAVRTRITLPKDLLEKGHTG